MNSEVNTEMNIESNNVLIVTGGNIDYEWAKKWLEGKNYSWIIAADSGLEHVKQLGLTPDYILGDYDSVNSKVLEEYSAHTKTKVYPKEKDYTDTHLAILSSFNTGVDMIDIIGATGTRIDHMLTNIGTMKAALDLNIKCHIYDAYNKIYLCDDYESRVITKSEEYGNYVSVIPMTDEVEISLNGFKYPLNRYSLKQGLSICQSNELIADTGKITVHKGIAIIVESRD